MSIRLRLTLWYSCLLAVTMIVLGSGIYFFVRYNTFSDTKQQIHNQVRRIDVSSSIDYFNNFKINPTVRIGYEGMYAQIVNYVTDSVVPSSNLREAKIRLPYPSLQSNPKPGFVEMTVNGTHFLVYQTPLVLEENNQVIGLLQVAASTEREYRFLEGLRTILIFTSIVVIFLAFTLGLFIARKALRPIEDVILATNRIENGANLGMRIPRGDPNDEIGLLTDTLNGMLARIETTYNELDDAYKAQRRFVSDASHELRTPLTTIRGNIDLLEKMWRQELKAIEAGSAGSASLILEPERAALSLEAMRDISEEAKRMSRLVADMLSLARADAGYEMEKQPVELLPLVEEVARRAHLLPRKAEWLVGDLSSLRGFMVNGNPDYLRQLVFIFIENAFKYTTSGEVELKAIKVDGQAGIVVRDTGIGMNSEEIPYIFERFYRADLSRGKTAGTGLGLSIVKWIIDEHNGSVEVKTREGEGTTFIVWLPEFFPPRDDSGIMEQPGRLDG